MTPLVQECYRIGAHLAARLEDAARSLDPSILEAIASECEGAARVLRRMAGEQRRGGEPV